MFEQTADVERVEADQALEVDVGIEVGVRDLDPLRGRFRAQARRNDIRAAADEIGGNRGRQSERLLIRVGGELDFMAPRAALLYTRGKLVDCTSICFSTRLSYRI